MKTWPFYLAGIGVAILFGVAATSLVMRSCSAPRPLAHSSARDSIRTSNAVSRALDSASLVEYGRKVEAARGDSLAGLLEALAARSRARPQVRALVKSASHDTGHTCVPDSVLRVVVVGDSACRVEADSLRGSNAEKAFDIEALTDRVSELERRPESCSGWSAFGIGFGVGSAATAGACMLFH